VNQTNTVKESSLGEVSDLGAKLADAGRSAGFQVENFGDILGVPLLALTRRAPEASLHLYLSAGIHGDEPAPPVALLQLLEQRWFDHGCNWSICPLLNPGGLARGTRENHERRDLNRDYRAPQSAEIKAHTAWLLRQPPFDLALCLHEDWEARGFYLYELNPDRRPSLAEPIVAAVAGVCPIDRSALIDGRLAVGGIIRPDGDPAKRELWPEAIYLQLNHTRLSYTLETPSALSMAQRIDATTAAVKTAWRCAAKNTVSGFPPGRDFLP